MASQDLFAKRQAEQADLLKAIPATPETLVTKVPWPLPSAGKTVRLTCAQALVEFFSAQFSEQVDGSIKPLVHGYWGIFGHGNVTGYGQALEERVRNKVPTPHGPVRYFRGQNEQGMALAATAFAKASNNRQICGTTSSTGPGATNLVTAAGCAHVNRVPVLLLPGDIFATRRPHPVLQQLEDAKYNYSVNDCLKPVSVFFDRVFRPEQLVDMLPKAAKALTDSTNYGPVTLCLPQDLQCEAYDFPVELFRRTEHHLRRQRPDAREVAACVELLRKAKRPLILCGGGVFYSGAKAAMVKFCRETGVPVCETQAGKGSVPDELCLGGLGVTGTQPANEVLQGADLLLVFGSRLADFVTSSNSGVPYGCPVVGVNVKPSDAVKMGAFPVVGDIKATIELLSQELGGHYKVSEAYAKEWQSHRQTWVSTTRAGIVSVPKSDSMVVDAVNQASTLVNGVSVCAAGGLPGELHKLWQSSGNDDYHLEYGYSCMGYEVAGGVGVAMARPDKEVFVMVGDGSWLMLHTEIVSARVLGVPINVVLVDNGGYGCIQRLQKFGNGIEQFGNLQQHGVDFVQNAKSLGVEIVVKTTPDQLKNTIVEQCTPANKQKCKVFVVETDPDISSPGYSWWDVAPPGVSSEASIVQARKNYHQKVSTIAAKL